MNSAGHLCLPPLPPPTLPSPLLSGREISDHFLSVCAFLHLSLPVSDCRGFRQDKQQNSQGQTAVRGGKGKQSEKQVREKPGLVRRQIFLRVFELCSRAVAPWHLSPQSQAPALVWNRTKQSDRHQGGLCKSLFNYSAA